MVANAAHTNLAYTNLAYIWALLKVNMKSALSLRGIYAIRTCFGIAQHSAYMIMWVMMFEFVPSIGGWGMEHILLAYGIGIVAWGSVAFFAYGLRTLSLQIDRGELDVYLTQPRPILINIALGTSQGAGLPEMLFGMGVLVIAGTMVNVSLALLALMVLCSTCVFGSIVLTLGSLGFWLKDFHGTAEEVMVNTFILSTRPEAIFEGWLQVFIIAVIPVTFMTYLPIEFLLTHHFSALLCVLLGTGGCMSVAYLIFKAGLRRYESGNRFGVRG